MSPARTKLILATLITAVIVAATGSFAAVDGAENVRRAAASSDSAIEVMLRFDNDLDRAGLDMARKRFNLDRRGLYIEAMNRLNRNRENLKTDLLPRLNELADRNLISDFTFYTSAPIIKITATAAGIDELLTLPNLELITENVRVSLIEPVDSFSPRAAAGITNTGLNTIGVRSLWNQGLTGTGTLICSFDTGIEGDHPVLTNRWRGNFTSTWQEAWFAPHGDSIPNDNLGHGTHVMGIMLGTDGIDTIGVAPDAQWISAAVIDQGASFSTTIADILAAFDWALNPDGNLATTHDVPDVICNSWGIPKGLFGACDNTFWSAIDNVEAAGIVTVFAAGNEGPDASTIRNPADRATSPTNSLAVGAIDPITLEIGSFSSRGPGGCNGTAIKPELVAPGVNIYSAHKDGSYKTMSGTSMATPFVAGIIALMRQYNPDATVEEIKSALMASTTDLGLVGEDNTYGHGLLDASQILENLASPPVSSAQVLSYQFSGGGDAFADPGETAELSLVLTDPLGEIDSVKAWLGTTSNIVTIAPDTLSFNFYPDGSQGTSTGKFSLVVDSEAISGSGIQLILIYRKHIGGPPDSTIFNVTVGHALPGTIETIASGGLDFTVSEFGQFGFGSNSIYQAGGSGFRFNGSDNLLYEGGLIIGTSSQLISDAMRDHNGRFKASEFRPAGKDPQYRQAGIAESFVTGYDDDNSPIPIPVQVTQSVSYTGNDFVIVDFEVTNPMTLRIPKLSHGVFFDFDLASAGDYIGHDSILGMTYQYSPENNKYVGLIGLSAGSFAHSATTNDVSAKRGFTKSEKYLMISGEGVSIESGATAADWQIAVGSSSFDVEALGRRMFAIALVAASTLDELRSNAFAALDAYDGFLDADDHDFALPTEIELQQNYPNPFNPTTTIRYQLGSAQDVKMHVYNITGQRVRTLVDDHKLAGDHTVIWDGHDDQGTPVASGVYFYRLATDHGVVSRKMVLLK